MGKKCFVLNNFNQFVLENTFDPQVPFHKMIKTKQCNRQQIQKIRISEKKSKKLRKMSKKQIFREISPRKANNL